MQNIQIDQVYGFRLSPQQAYQWRTQTEGVSYNVQCVVQLEGSLDIQVFKAAIQDVVHQYSILHTTLHQVAGMAQPLQVITDTMNFSWSEVDLTSYSEQEQENKRRMLLQTEHDKPFDLANGPVLRCMLVQLSQQIYLWYICLPALYADSWTLNKLVKAVSHAYGLRSQHFPSEPEEEDYRYVDVAEWLYDFLTAEEGQSGRDYWHKQQREWEWGAAGGTSTLLGRATHLSGEMESQAVSVEKGLLRDLNQLAQNYKVDLKSLLLTCWLCVLWRFNREEVQGINVLFSGRMYEQLEAAFGPYAKHLPLRARMVGDQPFSDVVEQVYQSLLQAEKWQNCFVWGEEKKGQRPVSGFAFEERPEGSEVAGLSFKIVEYAALQEPFALYLSVTHTKETLDVSLSYDKECLTPWRSSQLAESYVSLLKELTRQANVTLASLMMLSSQQRRYLLDEINSITPVATSTLTLHRLFEQQAQRTPDAWAVVYGQQRLSYAQLNYQANQLARALLQRGIQPGEPIGLCLRRSVQAVIGIMGILKAGGAYVPLDPEQPVARMRAQLQQSRVRWLVTQEALLEKVGEGMMEVFCLDQAQKEIEQQDQYNLLMEGSIQQLAYVIYTSGSTGEPKGVAVRHSSLLNYTQAIIKKLGITPGMHMASVSTIAADLGHTVIFPALLSGGCLHLIPEEWWLDGIALSDYLRQRPIDVLKIVPSHLQALLSSGQGKHLLPRHALVMGGEALSWSLVRELEELGGTCKIYNHYGPTETTVGALVYPLQEHRGEQNEGTVPIGAPLANVEVYILDEHGQLVPPGALGEIYIGGAGVAQGYLHQELLTEERFVNHPFRVGARLYRTGDRGQWDSEGCIEFLGRVDEQVKLRGHRIELGEIVAALREHPQVKEAIVLLREDHPGDKRLVGYLVARGQKELEATALRHYLHERLPDVMIPSTFVQIPVMPLTSNGKVDRRALPIPDETMEMRSKAFVAARTPMEELLVGIWEEVLNRKNVSTQDNFFDLGGHSLLAVQLLEKIQKAIGYSFPLAVLFQTPTVEQMAMHLERRGQKDPVIWSPVVALQPAGTKRPFFCVHPALGDTYCYLDLARHLGNDQPFYGLQARGLGEGEEYPHSTIEEMAACYVEGVLATQPSGPYQLGGHSLGGLIAFEMAQQLRTRGHEIALLAIMDTSPQERTHYQKPEGVDLSDNEIEEQLATDDAHLMVRVARVLGRFWKRPITLTYEELCNLAPDEQLNYFLQRLEQADLLPEITGLATIPGILRVMKANQIGVKEYVPELYQGKITLFCPDNKVGKHLPTWSKLSTEPIEIRTVSGDHISMLREPHVKLLAARLTDCFV